MTILGQHSIAEVKDLIKAKDYEQKQIQIAFDALPLDVHGRADWLTEWQALKTRYQAARASAMLKISASDTLLNLSPGNVPAEGAWQDILHALTKTPGTVQQGDVQDLYNRLTAMGAHVDESKLPQPNSKGDSDLALFQNLDNTAKAIDEAGKTIADKANDAATSNVGLMVAGTVVVGIGVAVLVKKYL